MRTQRPEITTSQANGEHTMNDIIEENEQSAACLHTLYHDIRIVEEVSEQPTLFGEVRREAAYALVDWETEQPGSGKRYTTMAEAERGAYTLLTPHLNKITQEYTEKTQTTLFDEMAV